MAKGIRIAKIQRMKGGGMPQNVGMQQGRNTTYWNVKTDIRGKEKT